MSLRELHVAGSPLVLPNAWDPGSARQVEAAGFPVIATGSAAMAESLGYTDHEGTPPAEMFAAVARISRAVSVPVTMDAESGYGLPAGELAERLRAAGAVGCNIEDTDHAGGGLVDATRQADVLAALRAADPNLVINARVDLFLGAQDERTVLDEGIARARAYLDAGADCVYPILVRSADVLGAFVNAVSPAAVNALHWPGGPDLPMLKQLGIARISLGSGLWQLQRVAVQRALDKLAAGTGVY
ncbi:MAG: isocitrate lyase/phosphoenolpyruvate mutase family protein [Kibdelosporangium sp.]